MVLPWTILSYTIDQKFTTTGITSGIDDATYTFAGLTSVSFGVLTSDVKPFIEPRQLSHIEFDVSPTGTSLVSELAFGDHDLGLNFGYQTVNEDESAYLVQLEHVTSSAGAGSHAINLPILESFVFQTPTLEWVLPETGGFLAMIGEDSFNFKPVDVGAVEALIEMDGDESFDDADSGGTTTGVDTGDVVMVESMEMLQHGHTHGHAETVHTDPNHVQPVSSEEVDAFVARVKSDPETSGHMAHHDHMAHGDHMAHSDVLDLVPRSEATHVAVRDGDWFDCATWYQGRIPDADAKVLIPKRVSVEYNEENETALSTVRVDGKLSFSTDVDTKILVDTMVVSQSGRLEIGTEENPIQDGVNAQIVIANNGDIDVAWDPSLLSRGVISHGEVEIHGAEKTTFLKVADAPMAGDTEIRLSEIPDNWSIGDTIVLTGTHKTGWTWDRASSSREHIESQDEEVVITAIEGDTITIDRALEYDHDAPREDLSAFVANTSRNITFSSENGEATEIHHRGHVMFMHNPDVDVRYAAFDDLGRTDKSDPAFKVETLETVTADSNIQGRYSLHFHEMGIEDQDNPAIAFGNSVSGSPGWGYVHHSSHAEFVQNVAFDVFGAAFVAQDGDETGLWWENIAIKSEGIGHGHARTKSGADVARDDIGRTGDGFFFSGRAVEAGHNVAANTTHGFVWMSRAADGKPDVDVLDHPDAYFGREAPRSINQVPIQGFHDNEAFGTAVGLIVVKGATWQGHDVRTVMDGFTNWETSDGVQLTYTSHYTLKDFDLLATRNPNPMAEAKTGFKFGNLSFDLVINGLKAEGFKVGADFRQRAESDWTGEDFGHVIIDGEFTDNNVDIRAFDPNKHMLISSDDLVEGRLDFEMLGDTSIALNKDIILDGLKTDSIGTRDRQFANDIQHLDFGKHIKPLLLRDGYFETASGEYVMIINDFVSDRATGELLKFAHVVTLEATSKELARLGAVNNGLIDLESAAPVANDDYYKTPMETAFVFDVLANDSDPDGDALKISGFTNPFHGDLSLQDDGALLFVPHENKVGLESFDYWVADENGQLSKGTVYIDILDL